MANDKIIIRGAREHNLKGVDVDIPREKLVVFTGLSGSGKSSLAFDTIYAEGQRRYVESLSSYARQFLGQMEKPSVDRIEGLSPAISIDQKTTSKNPRSTVGTVTEIYDYLRLLFARVGVPHCPVCGREIAQQSTDQIVDRVLQLPEGTRVQVLAPVVRGRKGEHKKPLEEARKAGYVRVRVDGELHDLSEDISLDKKKKHNIEIVVDRLVVRPDVRSRLADSVETASGLADGLLRALALLLRLLTRPFVLLARAAGRRRNAAWRCRGLTGEEFEAYVAQLLADAGFRHIELTRASGDQGVDVLAERGGARYAIQCKNYAGAVGNAAVQEAFAGAQFYGCDVAAVICPGEFTRAARELAASTGVRLWDGAYLTRLMRRSGRRPRRGG